MSNDKQVCLDKLSVERIAKLHPKLRDEALLILTEITQNIDTPTSFCRFTFTLRTFAEQQALYNQGRLTKGPIVTNSKAGQSYHNYGLAIDIAFVLNGKEASWRTDKDWDKDGTYDWKEVVLIFKKHGWEWGGDWNSFKDLPHFEKKFGHNWRELLELHNRGKTDKEGYVII